MSNSPNSQLPIRRFLVKGRVQGVFFRASTRDAAGKLGLRGFARNLQDGRVEVVASGESSAIDSLHGWLRIGSPASRVDEVTAEELESFELPDGFETR
jgi:acylphosphatase